MALTIGFTLHTAWLPAIAPRSATYCVDLETDTAGRAVDHDTVQALLREVRARASRRSDR
jgi:hypothetical protein